MNLVAAICENGRQDEGQEEPSVSGQYPLERHRDVSPPVSPCRRGNLMIQNSVTPAGTLLKA